MEEKIAGHYSGLIVQVRSAQLVDGEGIEIRGVSIRDPQAQGPEAELASIDEILLACTTDLEQFIDGEPQIKHIRVRRAHIRAVRQGGLWSAAKLLPLPRFSKRRVATSIESCSVEFCDPNRKPARTLTLREIRAQLNPVAAEHPESVPVQGGEAIELRGSLSGDHFQRLEFQGRIEPGPQNWTVAGVLAGLDFSPELRDKLPPEIGARCQSLEALRGRCELGFRIAQKPTTAPGAAVLNRPATSADSPSGVSAAAWLPPGLTFEIAGKMVDGRLDDPRLPQALTELEAEFHADASGVTLDQLTGRTGNSTLRLAGRMHGLTPGSPMDLHADAYHLFVNHQVERLLNENLRANWRKFLPAGEINVTGARLRFDGRQWKPELTVQCLNVSFTYHKFPYRLDRTSGTLTLKDDHLSIDLTAWAGGRRVTIQGEIDHPGPDFTGYVQVRGANLQCDQNAIVALPEKPREIISSLNPTGSFDVDYRIERNVGSTPQLSQRLSLRLNRCTVRYDKFPYPLNNVEGNVQMENGRWTFTGLRGTNDTGVVTCSGTLEPVPGGSELLLDFRGSEVVLEEELRDALPLGVRRMWKSLKPRGAVDLKAQVRYISADKKSEVLVYDVVPRPDTVSIEPEPFPYRLEKLRGKFSYRDGRVEFEQVRGVHERTGVSASGYCTFDRNGNWLLHFKRISADRLRADQDLRGALPPRLRKLVDELNPTGPLQLDGMLELAGNNDSGEPIRSAWDLEIGLRQSSLRCGVLLENLDGQVRLTGDCDGRNCRSRGELDIDALTFKNFQFTELRGPFYVDDAQALFGSRAVPPTESKTPRRLTAKLYGGAVIADLWVGLKDPAEYLLQIELVDGDLGRFAGEYLPGKQQLKGKVQAGARLSGKGAGLHQLAGQGQLRFHDADIYELPVMVALLKILSIRPPDTTAFTTSNVDFHIEGEHIYLDNIEFSGDAISLWGRGEMNFNSEIRASLSAILGRSDLQLPVLKNMLGQASLLQVNVAGTLADPQITREAFPVFSGALEQLQNLQPRSRTVPPQARLRNEDRR